MNNATARRKLAEILSDWMCPDDVETTLDAIMPVVDEVKKAAWQAGRDSYRP